MDMSNDKIIIEMYDEQKRIHRYELLDIIVYDKKEYAVMFPEHSLFDEMVEIFELKHSDDRSATFYEPVQNDYINMQVYEMFKENYKKYYGDRIKFEDEQH